MNQKRYFALLMGQLSRHNRENNPDNVVVSTASGMFIGKIYIPDPDIEISDSDTPNITAVKAIYKVMQLSDSPTEIDEHEFITLVDVTYYGPTGQINLPFIIIFADEIVGLSFGSIQ